MALSGLIRSMFSLSRPFIRAVHGRFDIGTNQARMSFTQALLSAVYSLIGSAQADSVRFDIALGAARVFITQDGSGCSEWR